MGFFVSHWDLVIWTTHYNSSTGHDGNPFSLPFQNEYAPRTVLVKESFEEIKGTFSRNGGSSFSCFLAKVTVDQTGIESWLAVHRSALNKAWRSGSWRLCVLPTSDGVTVAVLNIIEFHWLLATIFATRLNASLRHRAIGTTFIMVPGEDAGTGRKVLALEPPALCEWAPASPRETVAGFRSVPEPEKANTIATNVGDNSDIFVVVSIADATHFPTRAPAPLPFCVSKLERATRWKRSWRVARNTCIDPSISYVHCIQASH